MTPPMPSGVFDVILADPPWRYQSGTTTPARTIEAHYPTMTIEEITALPIPAAKDAILFLWTTSPKLEDAFQVVNGWGFRYRTSMVWDKGGRKSGMGHWLFIGHEFVLIGVKGKFPTPPDNRREGSIIRAGRGEHSEKPDAVHRMVEGLWPTARKLELFARARRDGWTTWGNQIRGDNCHTLFTEGCP